MRIIYSLPLLLLSLHANGAERQYLNADRDCRIGVVQFQAPAELSATWEGACKDGYADGMGVLRWFVKGRPHGAFEGVLRRGLANGSGYQLKPDDSSLEGNFLDGELHGAGVYISPKRDQLRATFEHGKVVGTVDYIDHDRDHYRGEWEGDQPHGQGEMVYALGGSYAGFWRHGKMDGKGSIVYPNGERLDGEFEQGRPRGVAAPEVASKRHALMERNPSSSYKVGDGFNVPPTQAYPTLTSAEKWAVKQQYPILQERDEPPYPLGGPAAIVYPIGPLFSNVEKDAKFRLNVLIAEDGKPTTVDLLEAPTPALGAQAAALLLRTKYKPALCAGKPCAMRYAVHIELCPEP